MSRRLRPASRAPRSAAPAKIAESAAGCRPRSKPGRDGELGLGSRALVEALFEGRLDAVRAAIAPGAEAMRRVSPHGHLASIHVPVFLLHGQGDTVSPSAETLWIASEIPPGELRAALVSPAIVHVDIQGAPPLGEQWALVHFMAGVLAEAASAHDE